MRWFQNLKTASKINILILLMSIFLIIVGLLGYYYTRQANIRLASMYEDRLLAVKDLDNIIIGIRTNQANLLILTQLTNNLDKTHYINQISSQYKEILTFQEGYRHTKMDPYEVKYFNEYLKDYNYYSNIKKETIKLVKEGKPNKARDYYLLNIDVLGKLDNTLQNLSNYNDKSANYIYIGYQKAAKRAYAFIIFLILLSLLLLIPLALFISRLISSPLIQLNNKMKQLAEGDLEVESATVESKDEIGMLSNSFNIMKENLSNLVQREKQATERERILRQIMISSVSSLDMKDILRTIINETGKLLKRTDVFLLNTIQLKMSICS